MKGLLIFLIYFCSIVLAQDELHLEATIYDFANADSGLAAAHPDFNSFGGDVETTGMVDRTLGADHKPVMVSTKDKVTSIETFNQWFNSVPGVNIPLTYSLTANWDESLKSYVYHNMFFFPIDGQGWGNEGWHHNYGFCMEIHSKFTYKRGQVFDFIGDDDVWVYINNELAIDLGGPHPPRSGTAYLDELGLTEDEEYPFDFFFCERHVEGSSLRFSTSIELNPCGLEDNDEDGIGNLCDTCPNGDPMVSIEARQSSTKRSAIFTVNLGANVAGSLTVDIDFGDGSEVTTVDLSLSTDISHTFAKDGEYEVTVTSRAATGCAESSDSVFVSFKNQRTAPSCKIQYMLG